MITIEAKPNAQNAVDPPFVRPTREEIIRDATAHSRSVKAGEVLEKSGLSLQAVARLSDLSAGELTDLCSSMTLVQATLLRDYFKSLLEFAQVLGMGEVVLSSVCTDTIRLVVKNSGRVAFLHDAVQVVVAMRTFEANIEARQNAKFCESLQYLRELELKFEQHAEKIAGQFAA